MTRARIRPPAPSLTEPAVGSWADAVKPQPKTESRIEREMRIENRLAYQHYDKPPHGTMRIAAGCPECAAGVRWFTHSLSMPWFPVDVERLFRR